MATIIKGKVIENSAAVLLARVTGADGTPIQQADVDAITLKVFDQKAGTLVTPASGGGGGGYTGTDVDPTDAIYDTLQTGDVRWTADEEGFNLAIPLDGSYFPEDKTYQAEVKVTPATGDAFYILWVLTAQNIFSE